jgi:metacaspase-1
MCLKNIFKPKPEPVVDFDWGKRCLLHFAINDYQGINNDLRGCLNDQGILVKKIDEQFPGFSMRLFQDSACTKDAFKSMVRAAYAAMPSGLLIVGYSGHGTYDRDSSEPDGYREALYLYDGKLTDDDLVELAHEKPAGLDVVFFFDSCFSQGMARDLIGNPIYKRSRFLLTEPLPESFHIIKKFGRTPIDWLVFSACAERQTAADAFINGRYNGAFTYFAVKTLEKGITYRKWFTEIRNYLPSNDFEQIPGLDGPESMLTKKAFEI